MSYLLDSATLIGLSHFLGLLQPPQLTQWQEIEQKTKLPQNAACRVRGNPSPSPPPLRTARDSYPIKRLKPSVTRNFPLDALDDGRLGGGELDSPLCPCRHLSLTFGGGYAALLH